MIVTTESGRRYRIEERPGPRFRVWLVTEGVTLVDRPEPTFWPWSWAEWAEGDSLVGVRLGGAATLSGGLVFGYLAGRQIKSLCPFLRSECIVAIDPTVKGAISALGNGVPLPMGRAIARAVKRAVAEPSGSAAPH